MANFDEILAWVLAHEGGYVNHPKDPGGATNKGVTQRVYDAHRTRKGIPKRSVRHIEDDEAEDIYRRQYWDAVRGDDLPPGLNYAVFDFAVNSGPSRAAKFLQALLGVKQDGVIGNVTLAAVSRKNTASLVSDLCRDRLSWMKRLKTWKHFGRGWSRRVMGERDGFQVEDHGVIDRGMKLARGEAVNPPTREEQGEGKAEQADEKVSRSLLEMAVSKEGAATVAAVAGAAGTVAEMPPALHYAIAAAIVICAVSVALVFVKGRRARA